MKKSKFTLLAIALLGFAIGNLRAQVAINNSAATPDPSAILDLNSGNAGVNKGFLPPQVALNATNVAAPVTSPATGLIVYNTATAGTAPNNVVPGYYFWSGSAWMLILAPNAGTVGQVLTSNGGGAPSWTTPASVQTNVKDSAWLLTGNSGTNANTNFIGTIDYNDLVFKVANQFSGIIDIWQDNTFFGFYAGNNSISSFGSYNAALGYYALKANTTGSENTALGMNALASNTTANGNTAIGEGALSNDTTGFVNTATGNNALALNTNGSWNTASGAAALGSNTTGSNNTAAGDEALYNNTIGNENASFGDHALQGNLIGSFNTAAGSRSLYRNLTGCSNNAYGYNSLNQNTPGSADVAIGDSALFNNINGSYNSALGYNANVSSGSLTNATAIGANAVASSNNSVVLGSTAVTQTQFNGALMPNYSGNYQAGTAGQVLTSQGKGVAPQWVTPSSSSTITYATGAQTFVNDADPFSNTTAGYSCTTSLANVGASITLSISGTYLIMASADCGAYSNTSFSYVGIALTDGTNYWGSNLVDNTNPQGSTFNWASWSTTTVVIVSTSTTYNIQAKTATVGDGYIRNARVTAIKLQ